MYRQPIIPSVLLMVAESLVEVLVLINSRAGEDASFIVYYMLDMEAKNMLVHYSSH